MTGHRTLYIYICVALCALAASLVPANAQRRISPVRPATGVNLAKEVTDSLRASDLVETIDDRGRTVLVDTVTGREMPDTLGVKTAFVLPLIPLFYKNFKCRFKTTESTYQVSQI